MSNENEITVQLDPSEPAGPNSHSVSTNADWLMAEAKANHRKGRHCLIIETGGLWQLVRTPRAGVSTIFNPGASVGANR
jgi:hypothetical protein